MELTKHNKKLELLEKRLRRYLKRKIHKSITINRIVEECYPNAFVESTAVDNDLGTVVKIAFLSKARFEKGE